MSKLYTEKSSFTVRIEPSRPSNTLTGIGACTLERVRYVKDLKIELLWFMCLSSKTVTSATSKT